MADVIQCPTCSKKFKLPDRPPAVFTCTSCGTAMDLSAFRGAAPAAAPAAAEPAAASASASAGGSSSKAERSSRSSSSARRSKSSGSGRPARGAAASRSRRGGDDDDGGDDDRGRGAPPKKSNALLIGSLIGFVVVIGIVFIAMRHGKRKEGENAKGPESAPGLLAPAPASTETGMSTAAPTEEPKTVTPPKTAFHAIDHNPDSSPDERKKIDDLVQKAVFENAGSDSRDAGHELVGMGMKAAPRLINVFATIKAGEGFDSVQGRIKAGVADNLLRKIDGFMEKKKKIKTVIKATSETKWAENTARNWIVWWDSGMWKHPEKPYDPRYDDNPDAPPAMSEEPAPMSEPAPMGEGEGGAPDGGTAGK